MLLVIGGCSGGPPPAPPAPIRGPHADFIVSPLEGYPFAVAPDVAERLGAAHDALVARQDRSGARSIADGLLLRDPLLHPAWVLQAGIDLDAGSYRLASDAMLPVTEAFPEYTAAQVVLGRAAEMQGDVVTAYGGFVAAAPYRALAAEKAEELRDRALEILRLRAGDEVARGRVEKAEESLARLREWAPGSEVTLATELEVAEAASDPERALEAARELQKLLPADIELLERRAALEVEVGEPREGMRIFRELAEAHPDDPELEDLLAWSEFRWRVAMLPSEVRDRVRHPELSRADFAVLLYWLFPDVRYGQVGEGRIATDVLEHPQRDRIVRVVNLGLMEVDPQLHRFAPDRSLTRLELLRSLLTLLEREAPPLACVVALARNPQPTPDAICSAAAACGLIPEVSECLPLATLSGSEALEGIRRTLELLEGPGKGDGFPAGNP